MSSDEERGPVVVVGAGGRAGRALVHEARRRGRPVVAVVRDPERHPDLVAPGVAVRAGDAADPERLAEAVAGAGAVVVAVSPFSGPPASFHGFDPDTFATQALAVASAGRAAGVHRIVEVGLAATLRHRDGHVADDPDLFPAALRPFVDARLRGIAALREGAGDRDWLVLTPTLALSGDAPVTGSYRLGDDVLRLPDGRRPLSYDDLAVAALDEVERPTGHREQVAVYAAALR